MTDKQTIVINLLREKGKATTKEIGDALKHYYYCNHMHYVSEILTRMVRAGIIERFAIGVYQLRSVPKPSPNNQLTLL